MKFRQKTVLAAGIAAVLSLTSLFPAFAGQWEKRDEKWLWQKDDGSYAAEIWEQVNGKWYRFNSDGIMITGWFFDNSNQTWYWLDESGARATGGTWNGGHLSTSGAWVSDKTPPANSFAATEEDNQYWQAKWQEYGLPDFTDRGSQTKVLTCSYDPGTTILPDLYNAVYAKATYSFNGFDASWHMSADGVLTFTVTNFHLY